MASHYCEGDGGLHGAILAYSDCWGRDDLAKAEQANWEHDVDRE
jgi:hypothetical protein